MKKVFTSNDMYMFFCDKIRRIAEQQKNDIAAYDEQLAVYRAELDDNFEFLIYHTPYTKLGGREGISSNTLKNFYYKQPLPDRFTNKAKRLTFVLKNYVKLREAKEIAKQRLTKALAFSTKREHFVFVIKAFNEKIFNAIRQEGYIFNMPYNLGPLYAKRMRNRLRTVDWGTSIKNKNEIIAKGGIPYKQGVRDDGEYWLVPHQQAWQPFYVWNKGACYVTNKTAFNFTASVPNILALFRETNADPTLIFKYKNGEHERRD